MKESIWTKAATGELTVADLQDEYPQYVVVGFQSMTMACCPYAFNMKILCSLIGGGILGTFSCVHFYFMEQGSK